MKRPILLFVACLSCQATNYYVSTAGSDGANGTSTSTPWQTVGKVNGFSFSTGDTISFKGGDAFSGTTLSPALTCTSGSPCTITSYGTGQATISVGSGVTHGISITNAEYLTITNLNVAGAGATGSGLGLTVLNGGTGILVRSTRTVGTKLQNITISHNRVSGFFWAIWVDSGNFNNTSGYDGFNNVIVSYNDCPNNISGGISITGYHPGFGGSRTQLTNVYVGHNTVTDNPGDPNSGTGGVHGSFVGDAGAIGVGNTTTATIEHNLLLRIAGYGGANNGLTLGGSTAIVVTNGDGYLIQYNEIGYTGCSTHFDGSAIDLDQDTQNSEIRYNLTYWNVGPSIQLGSYGSGLITAGNRIHHNISYNDVRGNNSGGTSEQGAIRIWGFTDSTDIFHNTIYIDWTPTGIASGVNFEVGSNTNVRVLNNIFSIAYPINSFHGNGLFNATNIPSALGTGLTALGNLYDSQGGPIALAASQSTPYLSLAAWRTAGYEKLSGTDYGLTGISYLRNRALFSAPLGAIPDIATIGNFDLGAGSAAIAAGIDPSVASVTIGSLDYHGNPATRSGSFDIGAITLLPYVGHSALGKVTGSGRAAAH